MPMKKFKFSLDSVLSYKQQVLDALKGEHAAILMRVREQEERLERELLKFLESAFTFEESKIVHRP